MSFPQVSVVSSSKAPDISHVKSRPIANFHPSIWMDQFLSYSSNALIVEDRMIEKVEQQKKEVRKMLFVVVRNPLEKLKLVDSIQRLGVSYHFENDIDKVLEKIYVAYNDLLNKYSDEDLNVVALLFRLLRQQGYKISCDIFTKFTENGKFKESLASDARGILSLYEAAHMRVHGEDLLEEALEFTIKHLKNLVANSSSWFLVEVESALKCPLRLALPRIKAREYMLIYEQDPSHNDILLTFSKLDFNVLQKRHQKELSAITRWWRDLDIPTNFPFARDRIVELYFWVLGAYFEPHFHVAREILTKVMGMISILDDIYDAYGTYEELQVFTAAIQRWDIDATNELPEYMKFYYIVLLDLFEDIGKTIDKEGSSYRIYYAKEAVKKLVKSYFKEAAWSSKKYKPNFKEYMELALDTSGYSEVATISFLGMGSIITKEVCEWVLEGPKIIEASKIICRLMDDIVSHKFEQQREHVVPAIKCYMEQYRCSEEEACVEFHKQIGDAWKDINEACLDRLIVPRPVLIRVLNLSRVINLLYREEDGYTDSKGQTKLCIKSLLVDPVPN